MFNWYRVSVWDPRKKSCRWIVEMFAAGLKPAPTLHLWVLKAFITFETSSGL